MKYCPVCQSTYTSDTITFCLQDGTALQPLAAPPEFDAEATWVTAKTPVSPAPVVPLTPHTTPEMRRPTVQATTASSNGGLLWKMAAAVLALALIAVASWAWWRESKAEPAAANNQNQRADAANKSNPDLPQRPPPADNRVPVTAILPKDRGPEQRAVAEALQQWTTALREHDFDGFMSHYANRLEVYYKFRNWTGAQVRADKARAFDKYYELDARVSDLRVTVEPSGRRALADFTKSYSFKGTDKDFVGTARSQLTFAKMTDDRWLIVGERDL